VLLDIGTVFAGIGVAVVGFVVVVAVCVVILRLLNAILPSYDDRSAATQGASGDDAVADGDVQAESVAEDSSPKELTGEATAPDASTPEEPGASETSG
jgi:hypothetical protein